MKNRLILLLLIFLSAGVFAQQKYRPPLSREAQLNEMYCSPIFSTPDATYFDLENDNTALSAGSYLNILDWLQGRVAGLQVYTFRNTRIPFLRMQPAAIYVDEMPVRPDYLDMLPVSDMAMIKVIKSPMAGIFGAPGGAIAIYTKRGGNDDDAE